MKNPVREIADFSAAVVRAVQYASADPETQRKMKMENYHELMGEVGLTGTLVTTHGELRVRYGVKPEQG